jgi:hypothetical protein
VQYTLSCVGNQDLLEKMSKESECVYDNFAQRYSTNEIFQDVLQDVLEGVRQ